MHNHFYRQLFANEPANNMRTLRLAEAQHPNIQLENGPLKDAYWKYLDHRGSPTHFVRPKGPVSPLCEAELRKLYDGARADLGLDWITRLRHDHGLDCCPFCGSNVSVELEHYFPEDVYPEYVILSWNLIPTCGLCNKQRGNRHNNPQQWPPLFHPYFEDLLHVRPILFAARTHIDKKPVFQPIWRTIGLRSDIAARVEKHYATCVHPLQFNTSLSNEWRFAIKQFRKTKDSQDVQALKRYVEELEGISSDGVNRNSWKAALYRSIRCDPDLLKQLLTDVRNYEQPADYRIQRPSFETPAWVGAVATT